MSKPKILVFAGSARKDSYNKRLAKVAASEIAKAGGEAKFIDLADYEMPLYHQDLEDRDGVPQAARKLRTMLLDAQGMFIASPEYNSSITPLLKNTIDWLSREDGDHETLAAFEGKVAAIASASPGALGGMRSLVHLRDILGNIGVLVVPSERSVRAAYEAFEDDGSLKRGSDAKAIAGLASELVKLAAAKVAQ